MRYTDEIRRRVGSVLPEKKHHNGFLRSIGESLGLVREPTFRERIESHLPRRSEIRELAQRGRQYGQELVDRGRVAGGGLLQRGRTLVAPPPRRGREVEVGPGLIAGSIGSVLAAIGIGAGLMYLFDPARGRRRRSLIRDQVVHAAHVAGCGMRKTARDASQRAQGLVAETRAMFRDDEVSDEQLVARVRSAMGRATSHPGAIHVDASGGVVTLTGPILEHELERLLGTIWSVRGVRNIDNQLEPHRDRDIPALQGGRTRMRRMDKAQENWSPTTRLMAGVAGGSMIALGAARRDVLGMALGLAGAGLAARGVLNLPARRLIGMPAGGGGRAITVQKTTTIDAPPERVFEFFTRYENFPHFMRNVKEVHETAGDRSHWVVAGPAGMDVSWDAEVTRFEPGKVLAWKSVEGSPIRNSGIIRFEPVEGNCCRVDIKLSYSPPGGALGHIAARLFGADPKSEMDQDLMRLKVMIETGHPPHDAAQPGGLGREPLFEEAGARETVGAQRQGGQPTGMGGIGMAGGSMAGGAAGGAASLGGVGGLGDTGVGEMGDEPMREEPPL